MTSAGDLLTHAQPDLVAQPDKFIGQHGLLVASPAVERNGEFTHDAAGMSRHDKDALRQIDRLVDIVGDLPDDLALRLPSPPQFVLHTLAGLRIERAERLVKQQALRIVSQRAGYGDAVRVARRTGSVVRCDLTEPLDFQIASDVIRFGYIRWEFR